MLPPLPFGTETNQMRFPLAMNLNPSRSPGSSPDLVRSLETHGVFKCVLVNGHGGNDLKWVLRELHTETKVTVPLQLVQGRIDATIYEDAGDHAGEMETSMGAAHFPLLVQWTRPTLARRLAPGSTPSTEAGLRSPAPGTS